MPVTAIQIGLRPDAVDYESARPRARAQSTRRFHFRGARIDLTHVRSAHRFIVVTPQTNVDRALTGYAASHGAETTP